MVFMNLLDIVFNEITQGAFTSSFQNSSGVKVKIIYITHQKIGFWKVCANKLFKSLEISISTKPLASSRPYWTKSTTPKAGVRFTYFKMHMKLNTCVFIHICIKCLKSEVNTPPFITDQTAACKYTLLLHKIKPSNFQY